MAGAVLDPVARAAAARRLFNFIIMANVCLYLEAGAVPAMLVTLADTFHMSKGQQGLLGGIVYLAISVGGPFAGYSFKKFHQKKVLGYSLIVNNALLLCMAMTPDHWSFSSWIFIVFRGALGLTQCFLCVYSPIWIDEFAPSGHRTSWMSFSQAAVPIGIMAGYAMSSVVMWTTKDLGCVVLHCWRWPFLLQGLLEIPFVVGLWMTPANLVCVRPPHRTYSKAAKIGGAHSPTPSSLMSSIPSTPGSAFRDARDRESMESGSVRLTDGSIAAAVGAGDAPAGSADILGIAAHQQGTRGAFGAQGEAGWGIMLPPLRSSGRRPSRRSMFDGYEGETEEDEDIGAFPPGADGGDPRMVQLRKHMRQSSLNAALFSPHITAKPLDQYDRMPSTDNLAKLLEVPDNSIPDAEAGLAGGTFQMRSGGGRIQSLTDPPAGIPNGASPTKRRPPKTRSRRSSRGSFSLDEEQGETPVATPERPPPVQVSS
uniref:Major facilitator superfamily (MFS) profile domain-containing protein n=1 Tax=Phaeomonas parva TaxID=124430 RepID=A0A7S1UG98_9STRA